jgi:cobalamin biosynthesis protein CbiG
VTELAQSARTAVRDAFPGARITLAREVRLHVKNYGDALTAVDVRARRGDARIFVSLRGAARTDVGRGAGSRAGTIISGHHRITQYETTLAQYDVLVQVIARANQHQAIAPLARLANDVRLVARY